MAHNVVLRLDNNKEQGAVSSMLSVVPNVKNVRQNEEMYIVRAKSILFENKGEVTALLSIKGQEPYFLNPLETLVIEVNGAIVQDELWTILFEGEGKKHVSIIICQVSG